MKKPFNLGSGISGGRKRPKLPHPPWFCPNCQKVTNPGYRNQCQLCNARRPE